MRWAAERETTRIEDEAYCLMGIFGVSMTTLYGEGTRAFERLQQEILRRSPDTTLFSWGIRRNLHGLTAARGDAPSGLFARSPSDFSSCSGIIQLNKYGPLDRGLSVSIQTRAILESNLIDDRHRIWIKASMLQGLL